MSGLNTLLDALLAEREAGREAVLATVVKVEGSAYRRPGARMLVSRFGRPEGTISGGCLEAEVAKKAWWLTEAGPALRSYSTAEADDASEEALSFGLGCNGKVHVLFERLPAGPCALVDALLSVRDRQQPAAIATVIVSSGAAAPRLGERLCLMPGQEAAGELLRSVLVEQISADLQQTLLRGKSSRGLYPNGLGEVEVLLEYLPPVRRLVIFGAGHDAQPLVRMAKLLGWHVTVIDGRAHFARAERFAEADQVLVGDVEQPFDYHELVRGAAVAVMTHSLVQDAHWLKGVLHSEPCYVGQLGPRERTERLLAGIHEQLAKPQDELPGLECLHYPIGLDLGGDTPESVAMAVLAEIQAVLNGRNGGSLRFRSASIHDSDPVLKAGRDQTDVAAEGCRLVAVQR
ncbi:xanthine dehydrogenase [Pseudomonas aeruginosa]|jgi:xanthine/CO dehydrogenase XdhC/CoxF family maturation factor|uniref:Xanthine dehydrogenase accessory factor n=1 Tax=Pseudomonas putida (strain ATCC 47054 / DSM 6125 / CFBP 8728 / NCIMB 11950 / KT2440) TaxID=160488 RepID=Q88K13_PSEPK|nr:MULTISPECIES: XdhC/CoxI family protein [Pseudomonas]AAN68092.1 putative Xanthine dehydrogenase accessory factor [Pseudomonas putida KT2440]ASD11984.1 xanthine dehydrogenase [Pseudomonas aeruginosa]AVZ34093.1 xanthine dehydrogenase [Pseudomonas aeruginosa]EKT4469863.1 XdhC family protein [Pseudomonas putida]EKT4495418.1 XdhC family protein [Pseudomonas putida]